MSAVSACPWGEVIFDEIIEDSAFGPRFSGDAYADDGNIATLRTTDISEDGRISYETMPLAKLDEASFANHLLEIGDLVITRSGRVGTTALFGGYHLPVLPGAFLIRFRLQDGADPKFFRYWFNSPIGQQRLLSVARGAAQQNINITNVKTLKVPLPKISVQRRIASILTAYDDLIENNRRRIQLLEQSARLLYKEWFVHLRFPGHEHVKIKDGVPEGWEKKILGDLCKEIRESVSPDALEPDTPYIGLEHMPRRSISLSEWGAVEQVTSSKHRFRENEILFGKIRPYFHKVGIAFTDGVASSDAIIIRPLNDVLLPLVLMTVSSDSFVAVTAQAMKEGSKMPRADWKQMQQYSVPLPPDSLLKMFNSLIEPVTSQLKVLSFSKRKLERARDLLLPRLMNGEVAV